MRPMMLKGCLLSVVFLTVVFCARAAAATFSVQLTAYSVQSLRSTLSAVRYLEGVDGAKLKAAVDYIDSHFGPDGAKELVIVRNGYLIWQGPNVDACHPVWSCTKTFTSAVLGLLVDDGKCTLDTRAIEYVPRLANTHPLYAKIRLRHLASMTGDYQGQVKDVRPDRPWGEPMAFLNPRPINNVKNYGAAKHSEEESVARFVRFIFAGGASTRFHRPHPVESAKEHESATEWGFGLSPRAQAIIKSIRQVDEAFDFFRSEPRNDLLSERSSNEAYCLAEPGRQYAVYFPNGGQVKLDVSAAKGILQLRWLDINRSNWQEAQSVSGGQTLDLKAPGKGHWAALVLPEP